MISIFDYTDYREYLRDFMVEKKNENRSFSYEWIRRRAGFSNRGFVYNIMNGMKKLSVTHCFQISQALGHNKKEAAYFKTLVNYAQAKNEEERTFLLEQIQQEKNEKTTPVDLIGENQVEYYSTWYHSVVRSLIDMFPVKVNFDRLSRMIFPPISVAQVKNSVELLERLKLIRKDRNGIYRLTGKSVKAGKDIPQSVMNRFHIENTELAKQSIIYSPTERRFVSSVTLGISADTYRAINDETLKYRDKIVELANKDMNADSVYQYQFIFFPLSVNKNSRKKNKKTE